MAKTRMGDAPRKITLMTELLHSSASRSLYSTAHDLRYSIRFIDRTAEITHYLWDILRLVIIYLGSQVSTWLAAAMAIPLYMKLPKPQHGGSTDITKTRKTRLALGGIRPSDRRFTKNLS